MEIHMLNSESWPCEVVVLKGREQRKPKLDINGMRSFEIAERELCWVR